MKKTFFIFLVTLPWIGMAQHKWELGVNLGINSSDVVYANRLKDWSFENNATTTRCGALVKYHWNGRWAIRLEFNKEIRGWNWKRDILNSSGQTISTFTDYRYDFWTLPVVVDFAMDKQRRFYSSIGLTTMLQKEGTKIIRATGERDGRELYEPSSGNGIYQFAGLANIGYAYPIYGNLYFYGETRFNLSFNYFEPRRKGYHYAYSAIMGITYRL
ncbi:MAG: hypothetical protein RIS64_4020 [Bacteroidota bacterium]|jgi:hypothetical protein